MEVLNVRTLYLSYTELEIASRFWDLYMKLRGVGTTGEEAVIIKKECDATLRELSDQTRELFLEALGDFERDGVEFQVKIAPDDAHLVSHQ